jgi:hypothetical protein
MSNLIVIWGSETCHELDRFNPESNADPNLPETVKVGFCQWWETAREPWCCEVELTNQLQENDIVGVCETTPNITGYHLFVEETYEAFRERTLNADA